MAQKVIITPKELQEVYRFAKLLKGAGITVESLIIFGSTAKGTKKPWSDIDLCVVSKQFGRNRFNERVTLMKLTDDKTINIEPHPMSPEELADRWDPLAHEIRTWGIAVS